MSTKQRDADLVGFHVLSLLAESMYIHVFYNKENKLCQNWMR